MKKYTRKFYNKKLVALGLSIFMGVGLTSTGFAAWVMSKDANETPEGNVNVAVITDASAKIMLDSPATYDDSTKIWSLNDNFSFDAKKDDAEGRIRFGGTGDGQDLVISFTGYLEGNEGVAYDLTAQVVLPEGITAAITEGYIAWHPDCVDYTQKSAVTLDTDGKFSIVMEFVWGEKFGGLNPCEYYDEHEEGMLIADDEMNAQLTAFHEIIRAGLEGKTSATNADLIESYTGKFKVQLTATPASGDETVG